MPRDSRVIDRLARTIARLETQVRYLHTSAQLGHSAIEDGSVDVKDDAGNLVAVVGKQFDGTYTAVSVAGPPPPTPSAPTVVSAVNGLEVHWDGTFENGAVAPMDFVRVDVATSRRPDFDPVATQPRYSFNSPRGGRCYIPLIEGDHYVALVARSESGRASEPSTEGLGESRKVSGSDSADDFVFPGEITVDQITSGVLNAVIQTAESGARVRMSDLYGFQVIDDEESAVVDFPADGTR